MRKFLTIIALAILTVGLIVGGIICFVHLGNITVPKGVELVDIATMPLAGGIAMFLGGICSGIMTLASFFKMKVRDAD